MSALMRNDTVQARIANGINILPGLWLIASPWVFDYSGRAGMLNSMIVGALIAMLAALRLACLQCTAALSGLNVLLGFWIIVSPWTTGYVSNKAALANNIMVGVFVMALAIWSARNTEAKPRPGA